MILIGIIMATPVAISNMRFEADETLFVGIIMVNYLVLFYGMTNDSRDH